jgi:glutamate---cysteine ligase / carboxylate-amine ligase
VLTTNTPTLGVEEEYQVVESATGRLVPRADVLVPLGRERLGPLVTSELNLCQIEVGSPVCTSLGELRDNLVWLRTELALAGAAAGLTIAATATHPTDSWRQQQVDIRSDRYRKMEHVYQVIAREQIICGYHVHIGFDDPDLAVEVMNRVRPWLPALLALSANSPFWEGEDTGYDSYRSQVWQRWPTAGMPPRLDSAADYAAMVDRLRMMGAIEDATFLYWYVRPSSHLPTLEFRPCDVCLTVDDAVTIAGLVRALAWTEARRAVAGAPEVVASREELEAAMWRASRYGLNGGLVSARSWTVRPAAVVVAELVDHVREALEDAGDRELVTADVRRILATGNGAKRQRQAMRTSRRPVARAVAQATAGDVLARPAIRVS